MPYLKDNLNEGKSTGRRNKKDKTIRDNKQKLIDYIDFGGGLRKLKKLKKRKKVKGFSEESGKNEVLNDVDKYEVELFVGKVRRVKEQRRSEKVR